MTGNAILHGPHGGAKRIKTQLVVPCYNEADRFDQEAFQESIDHHPHLGILFVNDGSRDNTKEVLAQFVKRNPKQCRFHSLEKNQGKAEAVRQGLLRACHLGSPFIGYWDADLATPLESIPNFEAELEDNPNLDIVLGSRVRLLGTNIDRKVSRHYIGRVVATLAAVAIQTPVYDTQCGAKLIRNQSWLVDILKDRFETSWMFDVELLSRYLIRCRSDQRDPSLLELPLRQWSEIGGSKVKLSAAPKVFHSLYKIAVHHRREKRRLKIAHRDVASSTVSASSSVGASSVVMTRSSKSATVDQVTVDSVTVGSAEAGHPTAPTPTPNTSSPNTSSRHKEHGETKQA